MLNDMGRCRKEWQPATRSPGARAFAAKIPGMQGLHCKQLVSSCFKKSHDQDISTFVNVHCNFLCHGNIADSHEQEEARQLKHHNLSIFYIKGKRRNCWLKF